MYSLRCTVEDTDRELERERIEAVSFDVVTVNLEQLSCFSFLLFTLSFSLHFYEL